jgi:hypothetical protein
MILITIPSKGRASVILKNTLSWLKYSKYPFRIFVEKEDYEDYLYELATIARPGSLIILPESNKGINYARWYIQHYCYTNKIKYIFQLDDDVFSFRDPATRGMGSKAPRIDKKYRCEFIFDVLIENSIKLLETVPEVGAISLMYGHDMKTYSGETWIGINKRLQTNYIVRTDLAHTPGCEKFNGVFADFTTFFNILDKGYCTVQYGLTGFDCQPVGVFSGGIQSFDRGKAAKLQMEFIKAKFKWVQWKSVKNKTWEYEPDIRKSLKELMNIQS